MIESQKLMLNDIEEIRVQEQEGHNKTIVPVTI